MNSPQWDKSFFPLKRLLIIAEHAPLSRCTFKQCTPGQCTTEQEEYRRANRENNPVVDVDPAQFFCADYFHFFPVQFFFYFEKSKHVAMVCVCERK